MPKVSILIPCYNAERWVAQAIQSALDQTHDKKEVVVVDDGSTDRSLEVIKSFRGQIRWETGPNRGGNVARNRLLELSTGEWLQYLDADDYLTPEKIASQIPFTTDEVGVVYSPTTWIECDSEGVILAERTFHIRGPHDAWRQLILWELPQTGGSLWKKSAILTVGGWKEDQPCCQEHELYFRLLETGKNFVFCPELGACYRQWSEQTVCRKNPAQVILHRMAIVDRCEQHLRLRKKLTSDLQNAIGETRYRCARSLYDHSASDAQLLATKAKAAHPYYHLPARDCFPKAYRIVFSLFGFKNAERLAGAIRKVEGSRK